MTTATTLDRRSVDGVPADARAGRSLLKETMAHAKRDRVPMMAGSIAYHGFLSLFPLVVVLIGVTQLLGLSTSTVTTLVNGIGRALPAGASSVLTDALVAAQHHTSGALTATIIAVVIALWSASSATVVLQVGLDVAYEVPTERKFVAKRLMSLWLLGIIVVMGGLAAALVVFASPLGSLLSHHVGLSSHTFTILWTVLRWVATLAIVLAMMALIYRFGPNRPDTRLRWWSIGGAVATGIWLAASLALSFYVSSLGSYAKTYGALAGVAVLLLWFYITAYVVLFGGELNAAVARLATIGTPTSEGPGGSTAPPTPR